MDGSALGKGRAGGRSVRVKLIGSGRWTRSSASIFSIPGADPTTDATYLFPSDSDDHCLCCAVYLDTMGGLFQHHGL